MPNVPPYTSLEFAIIPEGAPKTIQIKNDNVADAKTFAVYSGTHRIGRTVATLAIKGAAGDTIVLPPPLPPDTAELLDPDSPKYDADLLVTLLP